jgi:hypothetical protein
MIGCSVSGWSNTEEMENDIYIYKTSKDGLSEEYFENLSLKIEATANMEIEDGSQLNFNERLDNALCLLWGCRNSITNIKIIQQIKNPTHPVLKLINNLIEFLQNQFDGLMEISKTVYEDPEADLKGFEELVLLKAFLHNNLKKYNPDFGFGSVVSSMLELYERTKNRTIKNEIRKELKGIDRVGDDFGPYGDEIKEFPKRFRGMLGK